MWVKTFIRGISPYNTSCTIYDYCVVKFFILLLDIFKHKVIFVVVTTFVYSYYGISFSNLIYLLNLTVTINTNVFCADRPQSVASFETVSALSDHMPFYGT